MPDEAGAVYVMGDVHGQLEKLVRALGAAGLLAPDGSWAGGRATLWFIGDFVDRGPDGIGAIELAMRLEHEAAAAGGRVAALLGNHDLLLLSARRFGERRSGGPGGSFIGDWRANGGNERDLARLAPAHETWLAGLPALAREGDILLAHADSPLYLRYGDSVDAVNAAFRALLAGDDAEAWDGLLEAFDEHQAFIDAEPEGARRAAEFLGVYGGRRLVHGHTPISKVTGAEPATVREPLLYADGRCLNVDGGMYLGGPGFAHRVGGPG